MTTIKIKVLAVFVSLVMSFSFGFSPAYAAGGGVKAPAQQWHFDGMTGQFDLAAMQRGLKVYREVCAACHGLKRVRYGNLEALGYSEAQIKNIAVDYTVTDGPNDEGEMFDRPARPSDSFVSPYPNDKAAKAVNDGALPTDLSLIIKARAYGPDYLYALLMGYEEGGHGHDVPEGKHWNKYFPGYVISMAPPLSDGIVGYEDGSPETAEQYAHDVVNFLTWAADPYLEERKRMGIAVLIFLAAFAAVMYGVKKRIWADVH